VFYEFDIQELSAISPWFDSGFAGSGIWDLSLFVGLSRDSGGIWAIAPALFNVLFDLFDFLFQV
jgi:hypothetical protein